MEQLHLHQTKQSRPQRTRVWICAFASPFNKYCFGVSAWLLLSFAWFAWPCLGDSPSLNWRTEGFTIPKETHNRLLLEHKQIHSARDLDQLISKIGRFVPLTELRVKQDPQDSQTLIIQGQKAAVIKSIENDLRFSGLSRQISLVTQSYIDRVDSPGVISKLHSDIQRYLKRRGFSNVKIQSYKIRKSDFKTHVYVEIFLGEPCFIKSFSLNFPLPKEVDFSIPDDLLCDTDTSQDVNERLKEALAQAGYRQSRIESPSIRIDPKDGMGVLVFRGELGERLRYTVLLDGQREELDALLGRLNLDQLKPDVVGPESIRAELERTYRSQGYADTTVQTRMESGAGELKEQIFDIQRGSRYQLSSISFEGNTHFSDAQLMSQLGYGGIVAANPFFDSEKLKNDVDVLKAVYQQDGYWDVRVREPRLNRDTRRNTIDATFSINEGKQRLVGRLEIIGGVSQDRKTIMGLLKVEEGRAFDRSILVDFEQDLRSLYIAQGYLYMQSKINLSARQQDDRFYVDIVAEIAEDKRVKVGLVTINGLIKTKTDVVERELQFKSGDWYDPELIDLSRKSLVETGLFRSVQIVPADQRAVEDRLDIIDLEIQIKEASPGMITFGPGWSLYRGQRFNLEGNYKNIGGAGRQIFARGRISEESQQQAIGPKSLLGRNVSLGYLEPFMLGLPVDGTVSFNTRAEAFEEWNISRSMELGLTHRFRGSLLNGLLLTGFYGQRITESYARMALQARDIDTEQVRIGRFGFRFRFDRRNNISWPTKGYFLQNETAWARYPFGSELSYFFWRIENNYFFELAPNWVYALGINMAAYENVQRLHNPNNRALPRTERIGLEGLTVLRGFRENTLGPVRRFYPDQEGRVNPDRYSQGSHMFLLRNEIRYQIIPDTFAGIYFIDIGNVFLTDIESQFYRHESSYMVDNVAYNFRDLLFDPTLLWRKNYVSQGIALSYLTPIGSVNAAYGIPLKRCAGDEDRCAIPRGRQGSYYLTSGEFHINIGATF